MKKSFADFFAGIGLVELALIRNNWEPLLSVDYSSLKAKVHNYNFPRKATNTTDDYRLVDIFEVHGADVPDVFLAHASFPCTDVSAAGARAGSQTGEESSAIDSFLRILVEMQDRRPPMVMLENVKGLISSQGGDDLYFLVRHLNRMGYLVDLLTVDAKHFVPQSRERVFLIGHHRKYAVVNPLTDGEIDALQPSDVRDYAAVKFIRAHRSLHWTTWDLPELPPVKRNLPTIIDAANNQWWSQERTEYLKSQMFERHAKWIDEHLNSGSFHYATAFRRMRKRDGVMQSTAELRMDGIAGCLRTSKGGSAKQILIRVGKGEMKARLLSSAECAQLMGAGDFKIPDDVSETDALFCFGDAVCVDVVAWLDEQYLSPAFEAYRIVEPIVFKEMTGVVEYEDEILDEKVRSTAAIRFSAWCQAHMDSKYNLPIRGRLYGALIVLSNLERGYWTFAELQAATSTDEGRFFSKRSIKNHTRHRIGLVFTEHSREYLRPSGALGEVGRTSTGTKPAGLQFIQLIAESLNNITPDKRDSQGRVLVQYLYKLIFELLEDYQNLVGIEVPYLSSETITEYIRKLLDSHKGNPGAVLQHLVGAKLELRFSEQGIQIEHHSSSAADKQTGRLGDFEIGSTVFHVTKKANEDHFRKAIQNSENGRVVYLLVPSSMLEATGAYADFPDFEKRVNTYSIEQFLGQNLDEMARFDRSTALTKLQELLTLYNKLVEKYENDKSLRIVIPDFGQ